MYSSSIIDDLILTQQLGIRKSFRVIRNFEIDDVFQMGKRKESLGELYELCDDSSYNCSGYAEFNVRFNVWHEFGAAIRCK